MIQDPLLTSQVSRLTVVDQKTQRRRLNVKSAKCR